MQRIAILSFVLICLSACETETYVDAYLANGSSATLYVAGKDLIHEPKYQ